MRPSSGSPSRAVHSSAAGNDSENCGVQKVWMDRSGKKEKGRTCRGELRVSRVTGFMSGSSLGDMPAVRG